MLLTAIVSLPFHSCLAKGQEKSNHLSDKLDCIAYAELHQHPANHLC